jgi:hypothetical protein
MEATLESASARRGRACAPWKPSDVWTVSAVLHAVLTRAATLRALFAPTGVLGVPGPVAPLWAIDYLSTTTTETLADSPSDPTGGWAVVEFGRTALGPNYRRRARRSSPGPAPDPARRRLADIA